jgi:cobaltochelatase CobT
MDAATHRCNDEFYLDNHLKQVISGLKPSNIGVMGLGVGLDLTPFYHHNRILDFDNQNLNQQFGEWFSLLREVVLHR